MATIIGPIDVSALRARLDRASAAAEQAGVDALLISPGSDLRYLIGAGGDSFERLTCLALPADGTPTLVVPKLEQPGYAGIPTDELGVQVVTWVDGEDPYALVKAAIKGERTAVADMMPALHTIKLGNAIGGAQTLAGPIIRELRMRKDAAEVAALRKAGAAIDRVHARMGEFLRVGRTEREVAGDIAAAIVEEGHMVAEFVIVGSGPNGASPHHRDSDRVIEAGEVVVIDIGGPVAEGYNSDSTRTYVMGQPTYDDVWDTYAVLQAAQKAAVEAVRPGVTCEEIDAVARNVIADAGFGEYFVHRTGHGIGLDVHEEPYIVSGNALPLEAGMAFSVEPGIYLPGRWGARIEDIVVATADGVESFNNRPHELVVALSLEQIDRAILKELAADGRCSFTDLAERVGLSVSAVHQRVKRLEQRGIVKGYAARLDGAEIGLPMSAFISLFPINPSEPDDYPKRLEHLPEIEACYSVAGDASYVLRVRVASPTGLEELLQKIRESANVSTRTTVVLSTPYEDRPPAV